MTTSLTDQRRFKVATHIETRPFHAELVLLDLASGGYFALDPLGARIWLAVSCGKSLAQVVNALEGEYDVPVGVLARDVSAFADELSRCGLLVERR